MTEPAQTSAQIIQFPSWVRAAADARRAAEAAKVAPRVVFDSWYHDEAIKDSRQGGRP